MIKPVKIKPIVVKFNGEDAEQIAFFPRMAFKSEREDVAKQLAEIGAEAIGRGKKIFEIQRAAVGEWSTEPPKSVTRVKGENTLTPLVPDVTNAPDSINQFFAEYTVEHEEFISTAYYGFLSVMGANADFLPLSV